LDELTEGPAPFVRLTCRNSQPPFSWVDPTVSNTTCRGYLVDLWNAIVERTPNDFFSNFSITPRSSGAAFEALYVDPTNGTSQADMAIAFTSINTDRLEDVDFLIPYFEADFGLVIRASLSGTASSSKSATDTFNEIIIQSLFFKAAW
jgi:ABC-type amino acid transport substrate-binding protein